MAGRIIYLDIDDELTSAASRIRMAEGLRIAVVLPYGSRVATSRINFRLLARDALTHQKRLSIVAGDAATRALAASAGLPVFATVAEYESSMEGAPADAGSASGGGPVVPTSTTFVTPPARAATSDPRPPAADAEDAADLGLDEGLATGETARVPVKPARPRTPPVDPGVHQATLDEMEAAELAAAAAALARERAAAAGGIASGGSRAERDRGPIGYPPDPRERERAAPSTRSSLRLPLAIGGAILALILLIGGVAAYLLLPSATIVIAPRAEAVTPVAISIVADPTASGPDPVKGVVPAETVSVDVTASDTFAATGKRTEQTPATGMVRFRNKDFTASNTIPAGSVVSTPNGVRFKTDTKVTVPRANLVGLQIIPKTVTVKVTAVLPGPEGNVEPNTITVIPKGEDPISLDVNNLDATAGGTRTDFPKVVQADIDTALATLNERLEAAFLARLTDPSIAPPGTTVFPDTGQLGDAVPTPDPATLLDQEVATFDLAIAATGIVTAVNESPVAAVAQQRLLSSVDPGHRLLEGSIKVDVAPGVVTDGRVTFKATATATQVAILDAGAIKAALLGKSVADAKAALAVYGQATVSTWPDWVSSIPTIDARVQLTIDETEPAATAGPSSSP